MNISSTGCLLLFLFSICEPKSIDRALLDALGDADFAFWHDFKVPGIDSDVTMVRTELDMVLPADEARSGRLPVVNPRNDFWHWLTTGRKKRNAVRNTSRLWPRTIPFEIDQRLDSWVTESIVAALEEWMEYTCLEFVPRTRRDQSYIYFEFNPDRKSGCWSYVGNFLNNEGLERHIINLAPGCFYTNVIIHEVGHAIGLYHEHNRPDRDEYVTIKWNNVPEKRQDQFFKQPAEYVNSHSTPYDYYSIMHYSKYAFGDGSITMVPNDTRYLDVIGNGHTLSFYDAKIVNTMYSCAKTCPTTRCPNDGFQGKDCQCYCPSRDSSSAPIMRCQTIETDYKIILSFDKTTYSSADIVIKGQDGILSQLTFNDGRLKKTRGRHEGVFRPIPHAGDLKSVDIKLSMDDLDVVRYIYIAKQNSGDAYFGFPDSHDNVHYTDYYPDYLNYGNTAIQLHKLYKPVGCKGVTFTPRRGAYRRSERDNLIRNIRTPEQCKTKCRLMRDCRTAFYVKEKRTRNGRKPSRCHLGTGDVRDFVFTETYGKGDVFLRKC